MIKNQFYKSAGFEVIAFRFLKGRNPDLLKILKPKVFYYLNTDYRIDRSDKIEFSPSIPKEFYGSNRPKVNISAIVGKNGSGKSSIIDMMLRLLNNLGKKYDKLDLDLEYVKGVNISLYCRINEQIFKLHGVNENVSVYSYNKKGERLKKPMSYVDLKNFFYTIMINYSHYAYNTQDFLEEGNWLDGLFHKNDGYQTPVVINPFRQKGNIDINNEHHLAKARLISNFLKKQEKDNVKFREISQKQVAYSLKLNLNPSKELAPLYNTFSLINPEGDTVTLKSLKIDREKILQTLNKRYRFNYNKIDKNKYKIALDYILYKLVSICTKYFEYQSYYDKESHNFKYDVLDTFIDNLMADNSHITFKLKQTLNFLKYQYLDLKDQSITLDQLSNKILAIKKRNKGFFEISHFVPPPLFSTEIMFKVQGQRQLVNFNKLSSGEKQMLYSVSSLLYHLKNLDSIRNTKRRTAYRHVNIILEEVELYFHPELQRLYINFILDCIGKLQLRATRSINIIFITHSPFILSDIPNSKVLFLDENGLPKEYQKDLKTFGGNIHDLLANSFFLSNGFIGEFAKTKIQKLIDNLNDALIKNEEASGDLPGNIQLIGEPFLREKLMEMYFKTVPGGVLKKKRIQELEEELNRLKND